MLTLIWTIRYWKQVDPMFVVILSRIHSCMVTGKGTKNKMKQDIGIWTL